MIKFIKRLTIALCLSSALATGAFAAKDYLEISPPQPALGDGKIEVLEFFWFGCPHCYQFHPVLEEWKKTLPDNVVFRPVAAVLNPSWVNHARAYFAAEILGAVDKLHTPLFDELHKKKKHIFKLDDLADFAAKQGIDREKFLDTMRSFAVETKLRRSQQLASAYKINSVPTVAIAGKYVTSGSLAGSYQQVIQVMNQLIELETVSALETEAVESKKTEKPVLVAEVNPNPQSKPEPKSAPVAKPESVQPSAPESPDNTLWYLLAVMIVVLIVGWVLVRRR